MRIAKHVLTDDDTMRDFIDADPLRHSIYVLTSGELRDAIVEYIERNMAREKFDPDAAFLFDFKPTAETHVAVRRTMRRVDQ